MSNPQPPFEPSSLALNALSANLSMVLSQYETATCTASKAAALQSVAETSQKLASAATHPRTFHYELIFGPHRSFTVRLAMGMGVFEKIPETGAIHLQQLASASGIELDFLRRVVRALASIGILEETDEYTYAHTPVSRMYTDRVAKASTIHVFDRATFELTQLPKYFDKYGYKTPTDHMNTPGAFAFGERNINYFDVLERNPPALEYFNDAMSAVNLLGFWAASTSFPFDQLSAPDGGVVLVDVGGGKGQMINEILARYPHIKGRFVLQDQNMVLDGGTIVSKDRVEVQPYDFFNQVQPVHGAAAYFLKSILHDWPDSECLKILKNLAPAMRGHKSKLLICDVVIPDRSPPRMKALQDINMMRISGKERSPKQFNDLLDAAGFRLIKVHAPDSSMSSIVEAELKE